MKTFPTVEDYLEVIAGVRDLDGKMNGTWFFGGTPPINLARYDEGVVPSLAYTVANNQPLTQRQADLAQKIILKYNKQLAKLGIDVTPVNTPVWRMPMRLMDYSRRVDISGDMLIVKFPYDQSMIEEFRRLCKDSQGQAIWNRDTKCWEIAVTEFNVSWVYAWTTKYDFEISDGVVAVFKVIQDCEAHPYQIELTVLENELVITNAAPDLLEYINKNLGGLNFDNLERLIDYSAVLGYTIDQDLSQAVRQNYGDERYDLLTHRKLKLNHDDFYLEQMDVVLDYADATQRWPVVCFEPDLFNVMLDKLKSRYPIELIGTTYDKEMPVTDKTRYIHALKTVQDIQKIPLLITSAGMLFGSERNLMLQRAEKIVYAAQDVYTKGYTGKKVKKIAGQTNNKR